MAAPSIVNMHFTQLQNERRTEEILDQLFHARYLKEETEKNTQLIADALTPDEYKKWWASTPDDNEGFYQATLTKLNEISHNLNNN